MTKFSDDVKVAKIVRDYDGRPLEEGEVLALFPYNDLDAESVTNPDCIRTVSKAGRSFKCIRKAVPAEYAPLANAQFADWQEESLPSRRDGRCMIPQPDGTLKECPRKKGENHCSCAECPDRGKYEKRDKSFISIDFAIDNYEMEFATEKSAEEEFFDNEGYTDVPEGFIRFAEDMIDKSPKHACAMLLMSLGYKGDRFAEQMQLTKVGANYVRSQVKELAPNGITNIAQIDLTALKANRSKNEEYYRREARKALRAVIRKFF